MIKRPRPANIVIIILGLMYFITYLDRVNVSTAAAGFATEFVLNKTQIGLVFSAFAYPYLIFQIIGGWISDRFGARRTLIACGLLWAAATAITGMAGGLVSLLSARVLLGFGEGATFPAATTAMSRWVAKERRGFAQGITHAAARVGNAAAPGVIVAIMAAYGWRSSFFICAFISFLWVGLWALTFTEFPKDHPRVSAEEQLPGLYLHAALHAVADPADVHRQLVAVPRLLVGGFFLLRNDHWPDVGHSDGRRSGTFRHRERHHEYGFGACCHHQSGGVRLSDRRQRQLAAPLRWQHDLDGRRHAAGAAHASGKTVRALPRRRALELSRSRRSGRPAVRGADLLFRAALSQRSDAI
jgi:cyanate permease